MARLKAKLVDTMLLHALVCPDLAHDLGFIGSIFTQKSEWKSLAEEDKETYCARDVDVTVQIFHQLRALAVQYDLLDVHDLISVPVGKICYEMHRVGIKADPSQIKVVREKLIERTKVLEQVLPENLRSGTIPVKRRVAAPPGTLGKSGKPVKYILVDSSEEKTPWRSDKEVGKYLYETLGLPVQLHVKTQQPTTDKIALEKLFRQTQNPAIAAIRKLRSIDETLTTFAKEKISVTTSVHSHFNVHGTNSGRLSSSEPNLQNIPEDVRCIYIPKHADWSITGADFSSIENRITAWLARDTERLERFNKPGFNEHKWAASKFFNIPIESVEKSTDPDSFYSKAKHIVHGCWAKGAEILTPDGWTAIEKYINGTPIAEWDGLTQTIEFRIPKRYIINRVDGDLLQIDGRGIKATITFDHGFPFRSSVAGGEETFSRIEAQNLLNQRIPVTGQFIFGNDNKTNVQLAVALQADSTMIGNYARFHFHRARKMDRLEKILGEGRFEKEVCECGTGFVYTVKAEVVKEATEILTDKSFNANLLNLTKEKAKELLDEIPFWDGTRGGEEGKQKSFISTDKNSIIWIQTLAHLLGQQALLRIIPHGKNHYGKKTVYKLSFNRRKQVRKYTKTPVPYNGYVYCFETTSGYFLARQQDTICISGNSNYGLGARKMSIMYQVPEKEVKQLQSLWKAAIPKTTMWQEVTSQQAKRDGVLTNAFGRKRWFGTSSWYTESLSFLPQSLAADIILRCMIGLYYERINWPIELAMKVCPVLAPLPEPCNLILQVHDYLGVEHPDSMYDQVIECLTKVMTQPWKELGGFVCPIEPSTGKSWGEVQ